jgi:hypothetical protein
VKAHIGASPFEAVGIDPPPPEALPTYRKAGVREFEQDSHSNLRMGESKSGGALSNINGRSEKLRFLPH